MLITISVVEILGILKSHSKGTQSNLEKLGITFPALKFSFTFKVTEKFRSCSINMQIYVLFSNSSRISHSVFCDSMGLFFISIISLYFKPSFANCELLEDRKQLFCFVVLVPIINQGRYKKGKRKEGMVGRREDTVLIIGRIFCFSYAVHWCKPQPNI